MFTSFPSHAFRLATQLYQRWIIYDFRRQASSAKLSPAELVTYSQRKAGKRGGQNLTNRYDRLAKSIRQKEAFRRVGEPETFALDPSSMKDESIAATSSSPASLTSRPKVRTFRGLTIPKKPSTPEPDECCMSGMSYVTVPDSQEH